MTTTNNNRRITPTATLILPVEKLGTEEWLQIRREGITATDIPAILGLNRYKTAVDVWLEKVDPANAQSINPTIGNHEAALWGSVLEDAVAKTWADNKNYRVTRIGVIAHQAHTWARASLDRLVTGCPEGRCGLEVKTRSLYVGDNWDKAVPADVKAQVDWQMIVSGLDHIHVIALIGGQRLVEHTVHREQETANEATIIARAFTVWKAVETNTPPQLPEDVWTDDYLEQLHPVRAGSVEVQDANFLCADYEDLVAEIKKLETEKANLRTKLVGALGDHEIGLFEGRPFYTYKPSSTKRINTKALAELYPDIAADDRIWNETTTRTLRITT